MKESPMRAAADDNPGVSVLFDTYSLVFRAFHALPPMSTSRNEPTNALYGASTLILKVLREHQPRSFAFAVDAPQETFRHQRDPSYKANRATTPADLVDQLQRLPRLLAAFGVPVWCAPGYEADDVLATLCERLGREAPDDTVLVVSGDRDLLQLVSQHVRVWFIGARGKPPTLFDVSAVRRRFGVEPEQLPTWTALVGDPSDNIPGVPGVGTRTASRLVSSFDTVSTLLTNVSKVTPANVRESLALHSERLILNEELTRLRRDVPLGVGPSLGSLTSAAVAELEQLFSELEFRSLLPRVRTLGPPR